MRNLFAAAILAVWAYVAMNICWSPKLSRTTNVIGGIVTFLLLGLVYWIPFWLIFIH